MAGHRGWLIAWACVATTAIAKIDVPAYMQWLANDMGYSFGTVGILENEKGFRQVVAAKEIAENFLLAKLPVTSVLEPENMKVSLAGYDCDDFDFDKIDARSKLIIGVLAEMEDPDSKWKKYFEHVDLEESDSPLSWSKESLALFRGSGMLLKVHNEIDLYERDYESIKEGCSAWTDKYSLQQFMKGGSLVVTRAAGEAKIIPFLDLVNHDSSPNAEIAFVEDEKIYALVSLRMIREGEEVTISYTDGPADLGTVTRLGFMDDKPVAVASFIFPGCIPPSLFSQFEETKKSHPQLDGFSPELHHCAVDPAQKKVVVEKQNNDKACYAYRVLRPTVPFKASVFPFQLGPIKKDGSLDMTDGKKGSEVDIGELITRFRTLVIDSGFLIEHCTASLKERDFEVNKPTSMSGELRVMQLFKDLLEAHMDASAWVMGSGKPPAPSADARPEHVQVVKKAHRVERGVFTWYVEAVDFTLNFLELYEEDGPEALKNALCERLPDKAKKVKGKLNDFGRFDWLVQNVLAPLAFAPYMEDGRGCGVKQAVFKMGKADCEKKAPEPKEEGKHTEL